MAFIFESIGNYVFRKENDIYPKSPKDYNKIKASYLYIKKDLDSHYSKFEVRRIDDYNIVYYNKQKRIFLYYSSFGGKFHIFLNDSIKKWREIDLKLFEDNDVVIETSVDENLLTKSSSSDEEQEEEDDEDEYHPINKEEIELDNIKEHDQSNTSQPKYFLIKKKHLPYLDMYRELKSIDKFEKNYK